MKKIFKKIIRSLYLRYCDPDIVGMTRKQLQCFNKFEKIERSEEEQEKFNRGARDLLENPVFSEVQAEVICGIKEGMLMNTDPNFAVYDRFSINGVHLLKERLNYYATPKVEESKEFDKFAI